MHQKIERPREGKGYIKIYDTTKSVCECDKKESFQHAPVCRNRNAHQTFTRKTKISVTNSMTPCRNGLVILLNGLTRKGKSYPIIYKET